MVQNCRPTSVWHPIISFESFFELPLCQRCIAFLAEVFRNNHEGSKPESTLSLERCSLDCVTMETPDSCSLCYCMGHLVPADLPLSTPVEGISSFCSTKRHHDTLRLKMLAGGKRVLGSVDLVVYWPRDVVQHYESTPTMDIRAISRILRECEEQHNHHNWDVQRYQCPASIQLIDVGDLTIIPATTQHRYLALSYVWGEHLSFASTTKTMESLHQKGGLGRYMNELPQTIKDAMQVVRELGERYLWVDRLCIEQDNETQKEIHIQKMDVIYSHALITIIAHCGVSAMSPLPGVRPGTRIGLPMIRRGDAVMSVVPPTLWESGAPHETRGWTLQEQLLSRRCLYFDSHTTWFQCERGVCREINVTEERPYELLQPPASFNMHSLQSILADVTENCRLDTVWKKYALIVERYRTRELRNVEDMVHAIQGVAQVISTSLSVPLISAVPLSMLPRALQFYNSASGSSARNETAPSWSWAGWTDTIFFNCQFLAENLPEEAVELEMTFEYKTHRLSKVSIQDVLQSTNSEAFDSVEKAPVPAPLYTLLEIECSSTKTSTFKIIPFDMTGRHLARRPDLSEPMFCIYNQAGFCCGYSLGKGPQLLEEDIHSDRFQWILLSRSHPMQVSI